MAKKQKLLFGLGGVLLIGATAVLLGIGYVKLDSWRKQASNNILIESQNSDDTRKSLVLLQKASLLNPTEENYLLVGDKAIESGYDKLATHYFKKIKTADGYYKLGKVYLKNKKYSEAEKAFKKSLDIRAEQKTYLELGKTYLEKNNIEKARENIDYSYSMSKDNQEAIYYKDLINLYQDKNIKAIPSVKNDRKNELATITQPAALSTRINLLYKYLIDNDYPQLGFVLLQTSSITSQLDRDGYLLLANEYYIRKEYKESYQYLNSAKNIDPYYPQTYQHLAEVAELLGKSDEATQHRDFLRAITW